MSNKHQIIGGDGRRYIAESWIKDRINNPDNQNTIEACALLFLHQFKVSKNYLDAYKHGLAGFFADACGDVKAPTEPIELSEKMARAELQALSKMKDALAEIATGNLTRAEMMIVAMKGMEK